MKKLFAIIMSGLLLASCVDYKQTTMGITKDVGEGATSIDNVRTTVRKPQGIYSLDGRRHNSLKRGVNIVDGRKVVIR